MEDQIGKVTLQTVWEQKVHDCTRCRLHETRKHIVYGAGNTERPDLLFIGEGPGELEDRVGIPFIGKAGKLFNKMLEAAKLDRAELYICNIVACRPPGNRDPEADEIDACRPVWTSQIMAVRPRMIIALGKIAGNTILGTGDKTLAELRKKIHTWQKIPVQVTYHPAAMLRNSGYKKPAWEDLHLAMAHVEDMKRAAQEHGPLFGD